MQACRTSPAHLSLTYIFCRSQEFVIQYLVKQHAVRKTQHAISHSETNPHSQTDDDRTAFDLGKKQNVILMAEKRRHESTTSSSSRSLSLSLPLSHRSRQNLVRGHPFLCHHTSGGNRSSCYAVQRRTPLAFPPPSSKYPLWTLRTAFCVFGTTSCSQYVYDTPNLCREYVTIHATVSYTPTPPMSFSKYRKKQVHVVSPITSARVTL